MFISNIGNLDSIALIEDNSSVLTYFDLDQQVRDFSNFFDYKKHLVFIIGENDVETIVCYLSAVESGMVPILLVTKINQNQLNNLINIYKPKYIFQKESRPSNDLNLLSNFGEYGLFIRSKSKSIKLHPNLSLLLTTSGSTGSPKLVRLTKKNLISNAKSISKYLEITSDDRAITSLPFNYSYGLSVINSHLSSGGSIVLTNSSMMERDFWHLINKHSVTSLAGVPYNYEMILRLGIDRLEIPSIKKMTQAGGKLSFDKIKKLVQLYRKKI